MAMPWPPPMQAEPTAYLPPRRLLGKKRVQNAKQLHTSSAYLVYHITANDRATWAHEPGEQWYVHQMLQEDVQWR